MKARGGFIVDIEWDKGMISKAKITSTLGGNCRLRSYDRIMVQNVETTIAEGQNPNPFFSYIDPGTPQNPSNATLIDLPEKTFYTVDFMTEKGKTYEISRFIK